MLDFSEVMPNFKDENLTHFDDKINDNQLIKIKKKLLQRYHVF